MVGALYYKTKEHNYLDGKERWWVHPHEVCNHRQHLPSAKLKS